MSVRLHFDLKKFLDLGYEIQKKGPIESYDHISLGKTRLNVMSQGVYFDLPDDVEFAKLPSGISAELVEKITINETFLASIAKRRVGVYRYRSVEASIELKSLGKENGYYLCLTGPGSALSDMKELYRLIRVGHIWPDANYEDEMVPPPCRHLRQLFSEAWAIVRRDLRNRLYRIKDA